MVLHWYGTVLYQQGGGSNCLPHTVGKQGYITVSIMFVIRNAEDQSAFIMEISSSSAGREECLLEVLQAVVIGW
jgi:hypothetical protein